MGRDQQGLVGDGSDIPLAVQWAIIVAVIFILLFLSGTCKCNEAIAAEEGSIDEYYTILPTKDSEEPTDTVAKNLLVLPPWTVRFCEEADWYATYDRAGAIKLKKADAMCNLSDKKGILLQERVELLEEQGRNFEAVITQDKDMILQLQMRNKQLDDELTQQIKEKNQYKYKPNSAWIAWTVTVTVVAIMAGGVIGYYVAQRSDSDSDSDSGSE